MAARSEKAMAISLFNFFPLLCLAVAGIAAAQEDCKPARCGQSGPAIRFPFWLKGRQPYHCGYPHPDFELSCSPSNTTEIEFQHPIRASTRNIVFQIRMKFQVLEINYRTQWMDVSPIRANYCLPNQIPTAVNFSSTSPFKLYNYYYTIDNGFTLFNCSSVDDKYPGSLISCQSGPGYQVIAWPSYLDIWDLNLSSCTKMYNISDVPRTVIDSAVEERYNLQWLKPSCGYCEGQGKYCRLKNNSRAAETECFDIPKQPRNGIFTSQIFPLSIHRLNNLVFT